MNERINELVATLMAAKRAYYTTGTPILSDQEYDTLEDELEKLDPENAFFSVVGTDFIPDGQKVEVGPRMYSTDKSLTPDELSTYWNRTAGTDEYIYSQKIDGLAVDLTYRDGVLHTASTRGDGYIGRLFTSKIQYMTCIPSVLKDNSFNGKVRGEIFLTDAAFEKLNALLEAAEEETQSNCRNSASGLINAATIKNPEGKLGLLNFRAYGVYDDTDPLTDDWGSYELYSQQLEKARDLGFIPVDYFVFHSRYDLKLDEMETWLKAYDFPNDGIVLRVNNNANARKMGTGSKYLNAVTAYKFKPERVLVKVVDIEFSLGSREIVPVIKIEPVDLDGARITSVGGHSVKNLIDLEAAPGNYIAIERSGGVIPRAYHRSTVEQTA